MRRETRRACSHYVAISLLSLPSASHGTSGTWLPVMNTFKRAALLHDVIDRISRALLRHLPHDSTDAVEEAARAAARLLLAETRGGRRGRPRLQ